MTTPEHPSFSPLPSRELDLSKAIQAALLPRSCPECTYTSIAVENRMLRTLGGDFYDFYHPDSDHRAFLIGDVTGHGLYAALVMSFIYGVMREVARESTLPEDVVERVNRSLYQIGQESPEMLTLFSATLFFGVLHLESRVMTYINAGHPYPLVIRGSNDHVEFLESNTQPLGLLPSERLVADRAEFAIGDRLVLYTDGLTEIRNRANEGYGLERLKTFALKHRRLAPQEFIQAIYTECDSFREDVDPCDDMTLLVVDFTEPS